MTVPAVGAAVASVVPGSGAPELDLLFVFFRGCSPTTPKQAALLRAGSCLRTIDSRDFLSSRAGCALSLWNEEL